MTNPKLTGLTVDGNVAVDGNLTVANGSTAVEGLTVSKDLTANGNVTAVTGGTIFRVRELRGPSGENLNINSTISVLKDNSVNIAGDMTVNGNVSAVTSGTVFRIRDLRGPYGENLGIDSTVEVKSGNDITRAGGSVITDGDSIGLQNNQKSGWLYAAGMDYTDDRGYVFRWKPGNRVGGDSWKVARD